MSDRDKIITSLKSQIAQLVRLYPDSHAMRVTFHAPVNIKSADSIKVEITEQI
jgi:hypothetical protein